MVKYCRTTENCSWSVSLQWFRCWTLRSEHLVGFCGVTFVTILILRSKSKEKHRTWGFIVIISIIYLLVFSQFVSVHIIMFMFSPILCVFFSLKIDYKWPNTLFSKIHQGKERTHTCSVQKTFAKGARIKQPLYVCIGQRFVWEINVLLLSELNRFRPSPF